VRFFSLLRLFYVNFTVCTLLISRVVGFSTLVCVQNLAEMNVTDLNKLQKLEHNWQWVMLPVLLLGLVIIMHDVLHRHFIFHHSVY